MLQVETKLVHENGQTLHDGDPLYEGDKLLGYFRGLNDDVNEVVNVELPFGRGIEQFHIDVMKTWDTWPAGDPARTNGKPDFLSDDDFSSPHFDEGRPPHDQRETIVQSLLHLTRLNKPIHEMVAAALTAEATGELQNAAGAALGAVSDNRTAAEFEQPRTMSDREMEALSKVVAYLYDDEATSFRATHGDNDEPAAAAAKHIFHDVDVLQGYLRSSGPDG